MNYGTYKDGGVHVVWARVGARTWTTVADTDAELQPTLAEAERLTSICPPSLGRRRDYADEIESEEAEAGIAAVVYHEAGE